MADYTADNDLAGGLAIEPACGGGAFISAMIERLAASCVRHGRELGSAFDTIWACDVDLRRICVPDWQQVPDDVRTALASAFDASDVHAANAAAELCLYVLITTSATRVSFP